MIHADQSPASRNGLPPLDQCQKQVQRILQSATFRNATTLQQLFQFLTARAFEGNAEFLKEYTIGVEAFGRPQDFDPKTDTIVRVQTHRLRVKLSEYYESDGSRDLILIEIPKGHYLPSFESVTAERADVPAPPLDEGKTLEARFVGPEAENGSQANRREKGGLGKLLSSRSPIAAAVAVAVFATGFWLGNTQLRNRTKTKEETSLGISELALGKAADPVKAFWTNFIGNDSSPVIAFPDAVFLLDDSNDLFRFRQGASDDRGALVDPHLARQFASNPSLVAKAGQLYYENGYTGAGELQGIAMLSNLFGQMGLKATVKPSRDITPDDLRQHNVILFGSSFQNVAVAQLITTGDFKFRNPDSRLEQWRAQIVNSRPGANEESIYRTERDPSTQALKTDYSLVTIQSGVVPGRYIMMLGGLDTTGTQGAALFATSKPSIEELARALSGSGQFGPKNEMPLFQALIRVRIEKGYDVLGASLVSVHRLPLNVHGEGATPQTTAR